METKRIIKPGLFIYESTRIILLAFTLASSLSSGTTIPWMALTAPHALFPIMTLFLWLDASRYKNYLPLYIAGKSIGIAVFLGWSIISGRFTILQWMGGDLFALGAALFLTKEEKQCE